MESAIFTKIIKQEKQLIARSESTAVLGQYIDDEFIERMTDGTHCKKQDVLIWLKKRSHSIISPMQFQAKTISNNVILLMYLTNTQKKPSDKSVLESRSSLWRLRENRWQLVFHQSTRLP